MKPLRYEIEGKGWFPISRAAKLLRTIAVSVRQMMGDGRLDWRQTRENSRTFVVSEEQVMTMMKALEPRVPKPRDEKAKSYVFNPPRPYRDTIFNTLHLRLTLPHPDDDPKRKR